jgi:hypothetical protein
MKTDILIHNLALECRPVRPIGHPLKRFLIWIISSVVLLAAGIIILSPPHDVLSSVPTATFMVPAVAMLAISLICALSAFMISIPDQRARKFNLFSITVLIAWFALTAYLFAMSDLADSSHGLICILRIIGLSILPGALLFYMLKRAAPMNTRMVGLIAAFGALALGGIGVQFVCPNLAVTHLIAWHFMPVGVLALLGSVIGNRIFRWTTGSFADFE